MLRAQAMTASFYDRLTPIQSARGIFDDARYARAPGDWLLAVSDIKGSTQAVAEGRHSDVNFSAAAMIAALTNLCGQIPYQFGGDGASGMGSYYGTEGFFTFSHKKAVFFQSRVNTVGLLSPPFGNTLDRMLNLLIGKAKRR